MPTVQMFSQVLECTERTQRCCSHWSLTRWCCCSHAQTGFLCSPAATVHCSTRTPSHLALKTTWSLVSWPLLLLCPATTTTTSSSSWTKWRQRSGDEWPSCFPCQVTRCSRRTVDGSSRTAQESSLCVWTTTSPRETPMTATSLCPFSTLQHFTKHLHCRHVPGAAK